MRHAVVLLFLLGVFSARALTLETAVPGLDFVRLTCADPGGWTFDLKTETDADGVSVVRIGMSAPEESTPPSASSATAAARA